MSGQEVDKEGPARRTAFVTGGTGLLGNNLVRELLGRGYEVRALVRSPEKAARLLPATEELRLVEGDMDDVAGFAAALEGADIVFHTAAYFRDSLTGGKHWPALKRINVEGTKALLEAAHAAGVPRFLHVSSIGTLEDFAPDGRAVTETMQRDPAVTKNDYYRSKVLADREVEKALAKWPDFWATFILPGFMHGPGDAGPTAAAQTILDFANGDLPGAVDAHFSYVDARDVAFACVQAGEGAARGDRFLVAGKRAHLREELQLLEKITGKKAPARRIPTRLVAVLAAVNEIWSRLSGKPALISWSIYCTIRDEGPHARFDSARAQHYLGVTFRPLEETLADTVAWLKQAGMMS